MTWKTILERAAGVIQTTAGLSGYYIPPNGEPISCLIFKEAGVDRIPTAFSAGVGDWAFSIRVLMEEIGELPQIGGVFTITSLSGYSYYIESLDPIESNEYWAVCIVREDKE